MTAPRPDEPPSAELAAGLAANEIECRLGSYPPPGQEAAALSLDTSGSPCAGPAGAGVKRIELVYRLYCIGPHA